jgi:hypothetical protein
MCIRKCGLAKSISNTGVLVLLCGASEISERKATSKNITSNQRVQPQGDLLGNVIRALSKNTPGYKHQVGAITIINLHRPQ